MLKQIYVFFILLCLGLSLCAQESSDQADQTFTPTQLKRDFQILASTLIDLHPSAYQFISEDSLATIIEVSLGSLSKNLTSEEFHVIVRQFIRQIRCGHTTAMPSLAWYALQRRDSKLIPVEVILLNDQLFIRRAYDQDSILLPGLEILSIDDRPSKEIITQMRLIQEVDGFATSFETDKIKRLFRTYHLFLYGRSDSYRIVYRDAQGAKQSVQVKGGAVKKTPSSASSDKQSPILLMEDSRYELLEGADKSAVLTFTGFNSKGYKKYYKSVFKDIQERGINHLVLDLRGNGGGYFLNGNRLLRYLLANDFSMKFSRPRKKIKKQSYLEMPFSFKMTKKLFGLIPDRDKNDPRRNYELRYKPIKRSPYRGNLYVLTDGGTFSMGSLVATQLRHHRACTIIGQETGGGEYGSNAVLSSTLTLPETQVRVIIPNYFLDHDVEVKHPGRGVIPDIEIQDNLQEILDHQDQVMEQVKTLISQ